MTKFVFIEGISGVGKSTMVKALTENLRCQGLQVKSYLEFDYKNPLDFYSTAYVPLNVYEKLLVKYPEVVNELHKQTVMTKAAALVRYYDSERQLFKEPMLSELREMEFCYKPRQLVALDKYTAVYREVWARFGDTFDKDIDIYIFDGSLLHHPINDMMRNYGISSEYAARHVKTLLDSIRNINWQVFYLRSEDIGARLRAARSARGQTAPDEKQIAFWKARYEKDMYVLENSVLNYNILDISGNGWDAARERILSLI